MKNLTKVNKFILFSVLSRVSEQQVVGEKGNWGEGVDDYKIVTYGFFSISFSLQIFLLRLKKNNFHDDNAKRLKKKKKR